MINGNNFAVWDEPDYDAPDTFIRLKKLVNTIV